MSISTRAKSSGSEDLITALLDPRTREVLNQVISPLISENMNKIIDDKLTPIINSINVIKDELSIMNEANDRIALEYTKLKEENQSLARQLDDLTVYSRRDNLLIHGLAVTSFADISSSQSTLDNAAQSTIGISSDATMETVLQFVHSSLGIILDKSDISIAHRIKMPANRASSEGSTSATTSVNSTLPPPIVVRFLRRQTRDAVFSARKKLKFSNPGVYINEHLSPKNALLFARARLLVKQKKLHSTYTVNGLVNIKTSSSQSSRSKIINSLSDLVM
jgi:hypothetical protein